MIINNTNDNNNHPTINCWQSPETTQGLASGWRRFAALENRAGDAGFTSFFDGFRWMSWRFPKSWGYPKNDGLRDILCMEYPHCQYMII